jgi:hypothetical protein
MKEVDETPPATTELSIRDRKHIFGTISGWWFGT